MSRPRTYTDAELAAALARATSWRAVLRSLGLRATSASAIASVRRRADELGLVHDHVSGVDEGIDQPWDEPPPLPDIGAATLDQLRRAGPLMAAAWLTLCGHEVSWPFEPARYDLVVRVGDQMVKVQVKTAPRRDGRGWIVWISSTSPRRRSYTRDEVDAFFVVDGDLARYWFPLSRVAGKQAVSLAAHEDCRLPDRVVRQ